jgi:hypothetical protein
MRGVLTIAFLLNAGDELSVLNMPGALIEVQVTAERKGSE